MSLLAWLWLMSPFLDLKSRDLVGRMTYGTRRKPTVLLSAVQSF